MTNAQIFMAPAAGRPVGARAAVFLDRDGVVVENRASYIRSWDEVRFLPRTSEALRRVPAGRLTTVLVREAAPEPRGPR